jgi:hypothetical protein
VVASGGLQWRDARVMPCSKRIIIISITFLNYF